MADHQRARWADKVQHPRHQATQDQHWVKHWQSRPIQLDHGAAPSFSAPRSQQAGLATMPGISADTGGCDSWNVCCLSGMLCTFSSFRAPQRSWQEDSHQEQVTTVSFSNLDHSGPQGPVACHAIHQQLFDQGCQATQHRISREQWL